MAFTQPGTSFLHALTGLQPRPLVPFTQDTLTQLLRRVAYGSAGNPYRPNFGLGFMPTSAGMYKNFAPGNAPVNPVVPVAPINQNVMQKAAAAKALLANNAPVGGARIGTYKPVY